MGKYSELKRLVNALDAAQLKSERARDARARLPPGCSRARVTTANTRWSTAAEARDRALERVRKELGVLRLAPATANGNPPTFRVGDLVKVIADVGTITDGEIVTQQMDGLETSIVGVDGTWIFLRDVMCEGSPWRAHASWLSRISEAQ